MSHPPVADENHSSISNDDHSSISDDDQSSISDVQRCKPCYVRFKKFLEQFETNYPELATNQQPFSSTSSSDESDSAPYDKQHFYVPVPQRSGSVESIESDISEEVRRFTCELKHYQKYIIKHVLFPPGICPKLYLEFCSKVYMQFFSTMGNLFQKKEFTKGLEESFFLLLSKYNLNVIEYHIDEDGLPPFIPKLYITIFEVMSEFVGKYRNIGSEFPFGICVLYNSLIVDWNSCGQRSYCENDFHVVPGAKYHDEW